MQWLREAGATAHAPHGDRRAESETLDVEATSWAQAVWLALFRVPPFDVIYPVRDRRASCSKCQTDAAGVEVVTIFPGGHKAECMECRDAWLVLD
jgi:hypothetical protein